MPLIELSLLLLLAIAVGGALVHWTPLPLPILLVVVGVVASFLPGLGSVEVDPELFLLLFIPPILFADAWVLPRRDFVHTLKPVLLLALGLVVLTVVVVGYAMHWLIPAMPLAVAFTLGAIVSPTDAVATVATTQLLPLPARIVHIVNAESLLNDASGLVAFKLAVAAAATGLFSSTAVAGNFVHLAGGGIIIGIAVEWVGRELRQRLIRLHAGDPVLQTLLTILIPYGAYLAAEACRFRNPGGGGRRTVGQRPGSERPDRRRPPARARGLADAVLRSQRRRVRSPRAAVAPHAERRR
jgi:NhaP-type Na+/H+ and K+/H+ antiporters